MKIIANCAAIVLFLATTLKAEQVGPFSTATPESQGVEAVLDGLRHLHYPNDQKQREASRPVLDALYAFCQKKVEAKSA